MRWISFLMLSVLSLSATAEMIDGQQVASSSNKERDSVMEYPFTPDETVKIGIALAETSALYFLRPGAREALVNDKRVAALKSAAGELDAANKLVSAAQKSEALVEVETKLAQLSERLRQLDAAKQAAEIADLSKEVTQFSAKRTAINALAVVDDAAKQSAVKAAKLALRNATNAIVAGPELKASIKPTSKILGAVKVAGRTFALVDLGIKGFFYTVLDADPGYSPAAEGIYRGSKRLYQRIQESELTHRRD